MTVGSAGNSIPLILNLLKDGRIGMEMGSIALIGGQAAEGGGDFFGVGQVGVL